VDVEAFKKKIKNSQVRSVCYSSFLFCFVYLFVCLLFQKRFFLQKLNVVLGLLIFFCYCAEKKNSWTECIRSSSKKEKSQELKGNSSNKCNLQSKLSTASAQHRWFHLALLVGDAIHADRQY